MKTAQQTETGWAYVVVIGIIGVLFSVPAFALAFGPIGAFGIGTICPMLGVPSFTFIIVTCLQLAIETSTMAWLANVSNFMEGPIAALITLQVSLFGVQAVMGSSEINKKFFSLLLKIGCVVLFADNLGGFAPDVFGIM